MNRIKTKLTRNFDGKIDLDDVAGRPDKDKASVFLSRALAAFAIQIQADIDEATAASAVVDGYDDNGIDAIYYDSSSKVCYLGQSKFIHDGNGSIASGDIEKTLRGLDDFLSADFRHFNQKFRAQQSSLQAALEDIEARFVLFFVYTGNQDLSSDATRRIESSLAAYNDTQPDQLQLSVLKQDRLNRAVLESLSGQGVDLELLLHQWGRLGEPFEAFYGLLDLSDIQANWAQYGQRLTARNLRHFRGNTDVNDGIAATLTASPDRFFYLNNGLTILCDEVHKKPIGGASRESGMFVCKGASIVNGAQTVGTILQTATTNIVGQVLARVISLENCPADFGLQVTRAANTQNRIERKDFAALDPLQQRLATDVQLEVAKRYSYKTGDPAPSASDGCTIDDAAVALACAANDVGLAVQAKREVGALYDSSGGNTYAMIFTNTLTGRKLWRSVEIMRSVDVALRHLRQELTGRDQLIAVHGNRFLLHAVFSKMPDWDIVDDASFQRLLSSAAFLADQVLRAIENTVRASHSGAYPASLFKNATRCVEIERDVLRLLGRPMGASPRSRTRRKSPKK